MNAANSYDVIIIGTGAGGGTLGRVPAPSGKRIRVGDHLLDRLHASTPAEPELAVVAR